MFRKNYEIGVPITLCDNGKRTRLKYVSELSYRVQSVL